MRRIQTQVLITNILSACHSFNDLGYSMREYNCQKCGTEMLLISEDRESGGGFGDILYCAVCDYKATRDQVSDEALRLHIEHWGEWMNWIERRNRFYCEFPQLRFDDFVAVDPAPPFPGLRKKTRCCAVCGADISNARKQTKTCSAKCRKSLSRSLKV